MNDSWEENVFAGLENLDDEGTERVSHLGGRPEGAPDPRLDEPALMSRDLPSLEELSELEPRAPRLA